MDTKDIVNPELTIYDYWRIIRKRKVVALVAFGLAFASTVLFTMLQPTLYKSQATIKYQPPASYARIPGSDISDWDPRMAAELNALSSVEIAERAAKKLRLISETGDPDANAKVVAKILASYRVEHPKDSNLITILAEDPDPRKAGEIINSIIDAYRDYDLAQKSRQGAKTLNEVANRRLEVEENLRSLERSKQDFIEDNPEIGTAAVLAGQLANLKNKKIEFLEKYTPDHPEARLIEQRIHAIEIKLRQIPAKELKLARTNRELKMQEDLYTALNKQYEEAKLGLSSAVSFISVINPAPLKGEPVPPNSWAHLLTGLILGLVLSATIVILLENLDVSIGTIEEIESFVGFPVLGVIPVISAEKRTCAQWLARIFKKSPNIGAYRSILIVRHNHSPDVIESYHSLRVNLISKLTTGEKKGIAVVFTSASAGEGKTLTSINFALASAHAGFKTLLIDADMRHPVVYRIFGLDKQPGLSDILVDKIDWRAALCESTDLHGAIGRFPGINNLKILNCGTIHSNTVSFMDSYNWTELINEFKNEFDIIIFDTPPALLFIDAIVLAKNTDGVVMIYKAGKIARGAIKRATEQITGANARMLGVFLNGVRTSEVYPNYAHYYAPYDYKKSRKLKF